MARYYNGEQVSRPILTIEATSTQDVSEWKVTLACIVTDHLLWHYGSIVPPWGRSKQAKGTERRWIALASLQTVANLDNLAV